MVEGSGTKLLENSADAKCGVDEETFDLVYPQGDVPQSIEGMEYPVCLQQSSMEACEVGGMNIAVLVLFLEL
jgi:hypothetical protein